ncbi:hypothetical protein EVAR_19012_1 [Eumeta japonica]|uniref:Uncharacterized protein n=1 Tax=Eumeta variegata TaxID=151549 RepID=A0A4C1V724_EUMVA|nr:hypothetical protein EVAR_19012_1 [Eumeta japonica]
MPGGGAARGEIASGICPQLRASLESHCLDGRTSIRSGGAAVRTLTGFDSRDFTRLDSSSSSSSSLNLQPVAMTERDKSRYTEGSDKRACVSTKSHRRGPRSPPFTCNPRTATHLYHCVAVLGFVIPKEQNGTLSWSVICLYGSADLEMEIDSRVGRRNIP